MISFAEGGELIDDEKEAYSEFSKMSATARRQEDGTVEIRIPQLIYGKEELDEDVLDEYGDEVFIITEYEVIERGKFDDESLRLFSEMGFA